MLRLIRWFGRLIKKIVLGLLTLAGILGIGLLLDRMWLGDRSRPADDD